MIKILLFSWTLIVSLCLGAAADLGEGSAMEEEDFYKCFRGVNCYVDREGFQEINKCYEAFGDEYFKEVFSILKNASVELNLHMANDDTNDVWDLKEEYCSKPDEDRKAVFDAFTVMIVEEFTAICSDKDLEDKCKIYEEGLGCCFTVMEKAAEAKQCELPE